MAIGEIEMKRLLAIVICLPAFLGLANASPITLFDSIDGSTNLALNGIVKTTGSSTYTGLYASFSTSASPFDLQSVELALADKVAPTTGGFTIELFADSSGSPGGLLDVIATESDTSLTTTLTDYTFATNIALAPNTRYWIEVVANPETSSVAGWELTSTLTGPEVSTEYYGTNHPAVGSNSSASFAFEMDLGGVNTPEPSTILLGIIGLAILAAHRLRGRAVA
jgi:hypothetical protein